MENNYLGSDVQKNAGVRKLRVIPKDQMHVGLLPRALQWCEDEILKLLL